VGLPRPAQPWAAEQPAPSQVSDTAWPPPSEPAPDSSAPAAGLRQRL